MHTHLYIQEGALEPTSTLALLARKVFYGENGPSEKEVRYCLAQYMNVSHPDGHEVMIEPNPFDASTPAGTIYDDVIRSQGNHTFAIGDDALLQKKLESVRSHFVEDNCKGLDESVKSWVCELGDSAMQLNPFLSYLVIDTDKCIWVVQLEFEENLQANKNTIQQEIGKLNDNQRNARIHFEIGGGDVEAMGGAIPYEGELPGYNITRMLVETQSRNVTEIETSMGTLRVIDINTDGNADPVMQANSTAKDRGDQLLSKQFKDQSESTESESQPPVTQETAMESQASMVAPAFDDEANMGRALVKMKAAEFMQGVSGTEAIDAYHIAAEFLPPQDPIRSATRTLALTGSKADAQALVEAFSSLETPHVASELKHAVKISKHWDPIVASVYPHGLMKQLPTSYRNELSKFM